MIRLQKWAGMLTYVSKYFFLLAQHKSRLICAPSTWTTYSSWRMQEISDEADPSVALDAGGPCLEMYGYSIGSDSTDKLIVFTHDNTNGKIKVL